MPIKILIADDHQLFRKGLKVTLDDEPDMEVIGEASDGKETIDMARQLLPDVAVIDISMPDVSGIEATRQILKEVPEIKIIALSIHSGKEFVQDMLSAGASAYILKDTVPEELSDCIRNVLKGEVILSKAITGLVVSDYVNLLSDPNSVRAKSEDSKNSGTQFKGNIAILDTKLYRPPIPDGYLERSRLDEVFLEEILRPLTLVSAPAGYGKSSLVSNWLENCGFLNSWISLDESDNDIFRFFSYLIAAIQNIFPGTCESTQTMIQASEFPHLDILINELMKDFESVNQKFIIVLDDFHYVKNLQIDAFIEKVAILHPHPLHFIIISRTDPSLPLSKFRSQGKLTEIRERDLRFTHNESKMLLESLSVSHLNDEFMEAVCLKIEGWITGLRLIALSLQSKTDLSLRIDDIPETNHFIMDYLLNEVMQDQPTALQECLTVTAILDRFCGPLCESTWSQIIDSDQVPKGEKFLSMLADSNIFLVSLDERRFWFRYHHFFRDLLLHQLKLKFSESQINNLHLNAAHWLESNNQIEGALDHLLQAKDYVNAGRIVSSKRHELMNSEQWKLLEQWMNKLPEAVVESDPELMITRAWILESTMQIPELQVCINKVDQLVTSSPPESEKRSNMVISESKALRSFFHYLKGDYQETRILADESLEGLDKSLLSVRGYAQCMYVLSYQMAGEYKEAYSKVYEALSGDLDFGTTYHARLHIILCFVNMNAGNMIELLASSKELLLIGNEYNLQESISFAHYFLGTAHYYLNNLAEAETAFRTVFDKQYFTSIWDYAHCGIGLAAVHNAQGQFKKSEEVINKIIDLAQKQENTSLMKLAKSFLMEIEICRGELDLVDHWTKTYNPHPIIPGVRYYIPQFTLAKVLIGHPKTDYHKEASKLLDDLYDYYTTTHHNARCLVHVYLLQSVMASHLGNDVEAMEKLRQAANLAESGQMIRAFLDMGYSIYQLIVNMRANYGSSKFLDLLDKCYNGIEFDSQTIRPTFVPTPDNFLANEDIPPLKSILTHREIELLQLLSDGCTNDEIADALHISTETVKTHLSNIYKKLEVKNRRLAVLKADKLGVL